MVMVEIDLCSRIIVKRFTEYWSSNAKAVSGCSNYTVLTQHCVLYNTIDEIKPVTLMR